MENETILNDMQTLPSTAKNVQKYYYEKVRSPTVFPRTLDDNPVEFIIEGRDDAMIDLKNIQLVCKVKIRKRNAQGLMVDMEDGDLYLPYCGFMYVMWNDVEVELQHRPFHKSNGYYDLLTYMQILYSVPIELKKRQLLSALWYRDIPGGHDAITNDEQRAPGDYFRLNRSTESRLMDLSGKLFVDCFNVSRPLPEGVTLSIKFLPNSVNKCIFWYPGASVPLIEIQDMYLIVPRLVPRAGLLKQPTKIPWVNYQIHRIMVPPGQTNFGPRTIMISEHLPRRCSVIIINERQLNGANNANRLAFRHYNVDKILLTLNGEHIPAYEGHIQNFLPQPNYSELYDYLFRSIGSPETIDVSYLEFREGFVIFPFDLTQKNISDNYYPTKRSGSLELTIHFTEETPSNIAILVILEEERVLQIDKNREWKDTVAP